MSGPPVQVARKEYDPQDESMFRESVRKVLKNSYDKRGDLVVPLGKKLAFTSPQGEVVAFGYTGLGEFAIFVDGATALTFATAGDLSDLEASITIELAEIDGKLVGSFGFSLDVNGRAASFKLLSDGTTADIVFKADAFKFFDGVTEKPLLFAAAGVLTVNGDLAVTGSIVVGAVRWPVALQSKTFYVADGGTVQWANGSALSAIPEVTITVPSGVALASGEAWEQPTLVGATTVGATLRLKISTPGSTSSVTDTTDSSGGGGAPDRVMSKADSADAYNAIYNFRVQGTINVTSESIGGGDYLHIGEVKLIAAFNDGGGWDTGPTITISVLDALGYQYSSTNISTPQAFDVTVAVAWGNAIGQHGGTEWGVSYVSGGSLTDFVSVQYTKQSASGVRTGSPNGEVATLAVLPRNI